MKLYDAIIKGAAELKGVCENPRFESELLLAYCLKTDRTKLILDRGKELDAEDEKKYFELIKMRKERIPYQYIVGKQHFMGIEFIVNPDVLIPRPETEILVEEVIKRLKRGSYVLDIGTGSGAIAVSIARHFKECFVYAVDISADALKTAKINADINGVLDRIKFIESDLFSSVPEDIKFDFIVSNPPYIKSSEIPSLQEEVKREPVIALDGGSDGLEFYRKIIKEVPRYINVGGMIGLEAGYGQADEIFNILTYGGFTDIEIICDLQGIKRVIIAAYS